MSVLDAIDAEIKAEDDASKLAANEPLQKPVEEAKPPAGVLGLIDAEIEAEQNPVPFAGKKAEELDTTDYEVLNYLSPEKLTEVSNTRKDIPLPDDLLRKKFDYQRSLPWNEGMRTMEDWYNIGAGVVETGKSLAKGVGKVAYNVFDPTGDKGFQSIKDFVSPAVELPSMAANLATKLYEGGMDWTDRLSEKFGLHDQEKSFENYKARHLVDQIQAQAAQEDPSIYGRLIKSNFVKEGLAQIALSTIPDAQTISEQEGVSLEKAKQIRKDRAYQIAEQTASERAAMEPETDEDIATAGTFLLPSSLGLGEMGLVSLGAEAALKSAPQIARGIKYAGKTDAQIKAINDAAQIAAREKALETLARRQQPSFIGKAAGAVADKIDDAAIALKNISEKTPQILKDVVPVVGGGAIGYGVSDENRGGGILAGALLGKAGRPALKAAAYATKLPALVREIDAARAISAGGTKGTFEILGGTPNVSKEAAKILRYGGRRIDDILENSVEYAKAGIHGTTLALATGALESASPEELNNMLASGLFYIGGGRAAHHVFGKLTGVDPVVEARRRRQQVQDDLKTYQDLDQASKDTLNSVTSWDNVIANRQKVVQQAETAYNDALARGSNDAERLGKNLKAQRAALSMLNRANVQTRNEYGRQFITQLTRNNQLVNGVLRAGQNNVGISILTPKQIFDKFRQDPANAAATDQELMDAAQQRGFYSTPEGAVEYQAGMGMEAPKSKMIFDRTKPSIVINADHLKARMLIDGESAAEVLNHEVGHHVRNIPEFRDANKDAEAMLFSQEIRDPSGNIVATTSGRYSPKDLVEMYKKNYMKDKMPDEIEQLSKLAGLWDFSRNDLNENAVASYMRDEIIADLNAETLSRHLGEDLDSGTKHIIDLARVKTKKSILDRAIIKFAGLGGKGDPTSELTGAEYSPEVMAANRNAMRALQSLQGEVSAAVRSPDEPKINRAEMMRNKALMERYGKYSGLFKTKVQAQIFDGNGNPVGAPIDIANPNAAEGSWQNKNGQVRQLNGYGQRPDEVSEANGIVIPDGGSLVVGRQIVMQPDGKTPILLDAKEAKKLQKDRTDVVRNALNTPDEGAPNRFEPTGDPDGTWRGTLTPLQIDAIKNLPEGIVPKSIKEHILKINDMIVRGDGSRMLVDYAAVMNDSGKYTPYSAKIYDVVPIGMHLSKNGHFLVTTISVGRMFDKLNAWSERMPARLAPWGGSKDAFFKEFTETYLQNWQNGLAGETGLAGTPAEAIAKKNIFADFLNLATKDTAPLNPDRTKTPRRKGDVRGKDIDRTIMSMRLDHMAELIDNDGAPKIPVSYQKAKFNMMPAEPAPETPMEERRPSAINLGISATYTPERKPFEARYVAPEGAALTASLVASGTSLESFGKESLAKLAEYYGITIPDGASRGEIIDSINERPIEAPIAAQPQETKFSFTTSTERDDAIKKLIATGDDQGIRDLNRTTILSALADLKNIQVAIEDAKGVYKGDKEVSSIIKVTTTSQQDLNRVRSRIADVAKMFQQMEFLEEKMGAGKRGLFGKTDEDGFKHIGSSTLYVEGVTDDQIEQARKQAGIDGLTLADGRIELYDRSDDPEFFNRVTALDTAIRQAGGVVTSSETGVASVKSYSEDPQRYAGTIGYDDQSLQIYSAAGESERLKTPLVQKLMGLMGRPMEAPKSGKRSYFEAKDLTPEQVKKQVGIAQRFISLPLNDLANPLVKKAYERLNIEIGKQYDYLTEGKDGTKFTSQPYELAGEPYESSADAINDIRTKNSLKFLKTDPSSFGPEGEDFSYHPLLQDSGRVDANGVRLTYNDLFRAVHDAIAHGLFGAEFGPIGEESAWQTHMRTLDDPWARWALTTETRGQNSYVNYREQMLGQDGMPLQKGDDGYIPLKERGFAEQKAALLPLEDSLTGDKKVDEVTRKLMNEIGEDQSQGSAGISFMPADEKYPTSERGFYSGLQKTIDEKMPAKASPQQILSIVDNPQNAKPEEVKWSNLAGFLEGKQSVTKQEVLDYLKNEGSVKFEEVSTQLTEKQKGEIEWAKKTWDNLKKEYQDLQEKWASEKDPIKKAQIAEEASSIEQNMDDLDNEIKESTKLQKTQYSQYVLPNGENYREVVLTMPTGAENAELAYNDYNQSLREKYGVEDIGLVISEQEREIAQKLYEKINEGYRGEYTSSHFRDIPNYVAHMRLNERPDSEGRNGLFIEEIQSDRHQQGREKGYAGEGTNEMEEFEKLRDIPASQRTQEQQARFDELSFKVLKSQERGIPDAPFRKDWSVQMFKRALRDAIEGDKEWIGWTKGETQAERFDISKQVDEIRHYPDMGYGEDKYIRIELDLANGQKHLLSVNKETGNTISGVGPAEWSGKPLAEIIGKETADKILSGQGEDKVSEPQGLARLGGTTPKNYKSLSGEGLKIGGQGMKGFYDQILPKEVGKYVKKWGAKVEEGKIGQSISKEDMDMGDISDATPEELAQLEAQGMVTGPSVKIWKVAITPEMRESIKNEGQIAFMPKVAVVPERFTGTGGEEARRGKYVEPPKFFGQFNISQYEKGGKFFDAETGEDITDKSYENASISVDGGKPSLVANNESESMGTGPIVRSNLFKQKAGWKWISENAPETSTIVSVEGQGKHVYTLRADFQNGVKMARYPDKTSEPRLRPTGRGELVMGQEIGRIDIRGKKHPVYDTITIGEKPASDISFMPAAKLDEAHAKAIESGDMEEAQRLVDDAARKAGLDTNGEDGWWHGSRSKDPFTIFNTDNTPETGWRGLGAYFGIGEQAKGFGSNNNRRFYLKLDKTLNTTFEKLIDRFDDPVEARRALEQEGYDSVMSDPYAGAIAVFRPEQIKSADPATYDNEGKLIPLSKRFDTSNPDIRFMPYSPELPKTEDGKVDWAGFKTRTQETAKPLAALAPLGGISFMGKKEKSPMPMSALNVLHADSDVLPKPDKKVANAKVAVQLADIAEQHHGRVITSNDITLEEEQKFIQNGADEAESALKASGKNAGNWYSTAMKAAVAVAGVIHKVISDPKEAMKNPHFAKEPDPTKAAQFAFLIPLAITSQNQTVPLNTRYGEEQFNHFQKTGKFDPTKIYGEKAASISGNLELANHLIDVMGGLTKLEDFVKQEFSVKELEDAASKIAGRKITIAGRKTDMVNGAAIFGPKIGQGFLQNLMGKFDPVTIDLWMRRTWGRWTGDVVGDGVTGVRLGRLIQEYRNSGRRLPDSLKNLRTVMRSTGTTSTGKPTKPELTVSGNVQDRIETDPEFRKSIEQLSKEANAEFQGYYKLMGSPVSDAMILEINKVAPAGKIKYSEETRNERDFAYNKLIKEQLKIKNDLDEKWGQLSSVEKKALNAEDPKKAISKAKWIEQQHANAGRTKVLANEQKNAIKPQWASAAKSIVADLNPIDIPTDQDRVVISRVVNGIRKTLESRGYNVTNADVQAILWYPEKDLWAKLRGEEESNLKQSYDDELLKIAEQRGYGEEARAVAKRIRGY